MFGKIYAQIPISCLRNKGLRSITNKTNTQIIDYRKKHIGKSLKLHYDKPIRIVRGEGVYLIDHKGKQIFRYRK